MGRDRAKRPGADSLRLFAAIDLSGAATEIIEAAIAPWRERFPRGRWVPRQNWHITLKFLGRTWPRLLPVVEDACRASAAEAKPFEVKPSGFGVFPGPKRVRVLWVGLDDSAEGLTSIAAALDDRLAEEFPPEKRAFTAHLTVARFNPPVPMGDHAEALAATQIDSPASTIDRLVLYRSHLSPRGARYEALREFPVGG